ncbi:MAG: hypothetical protein [Siphoviridae sp. ctjeG17]|nr:MAG: hypothetical protein [Siphoviridae sp. ctjeG17]
MFSYPQNIFFMFSYPQNIKSIITIYILYLNRL